MKTFTTLFTALFILILSYAGYSQVRISSCDNFNAFMSGSRTTLESITDTIYPNGRMLFIPDSVLGKDIVNLFSLLELDERTTFEIDGEANDLFDPEIKMVRYRQLYGDIVVEGGGATVDLATPGGPTYDDDRCRQIHAISPFVLNGFNDMDVEPTLNDDSDLQTVLDVDSIISAALKISTHIDSCQYRLVYDVTYIDTFPKRSWIDANTGAILRTVKTYGCFNAPTEDFSSRPMSDTPLDGTTTMLMSGNGHLATYDIKQEIDVTQITINDYTQARIPTMLTSNGVWGTTDAPSSVFQAHWMAELTLDYLSEFFTFDEVHVAANASEFNAIALENAADERTAYIAFGTHPTGGTLAHFDVMGHEFTHKYLFKWLDIGVITSGGLHEAIADMIGVYNEEQWQTIPDWEMGDDIPQGDGRDLENPFFSCITQANFTHTDDNHIRGVPLGHWFFLVSAGSTSLDIPALGTEKTLKIVFNVVTKIGMTSDVVDLMHAIIIHTLETFGRCSEEFISVARAFEEICAVTGLVDGSTIPTCDYNFEVQTVVCEENDYLKVCLTNSVPGYHFKWTVKGVQSSQFVLNGNQTGNSTTGQDLTCLEIYSFPTYQYYPQVVTIECYSPNLGSSYLVSKRFTIYDCEHDDPTCDEYYENIGISQDNSDTNTAYSMEFDVSDIHENDIYEQIGVNIRIYDMLGRLLFSGNSDTPERALNKIDPANGVFVVVVLDDVGVVMDVNKVYYYSGE